MYEHQHTFISIIAYLQTTHHNANQRSTRIRVAANSRVLDVRWNRPESIGELKETSVNLADKSKQNLVRLFFQVSVRFNRIALVLLQHGFNKCQRRIKQAEKSIKSRLPRRQSQHNGHVLNERLNVLIDVMLRTMGLTKFHCFFPGKIIDELDFILTWVMDENIPYNREMKYASSELADLCVMARDHFENTIKPALKNKTFLQLNAPSARSTATSELYFHCSNSQCATHVRSLEQKCDRLITKVFSTSMLNINRFI